MRARPFTALCLFLALIGCSDEPVFEYDSRPIELQRAPTAPGGQALGATLARVRVGSDTPLLLIDTGSLLSSLNRGVCPTATPEPAASPSSIFARARGVTLAPRWPECWGEISCTTSRWHSRFRATRTCLPP